MFSYMYIDPNIEDNRMEIRELRDYVLEHILHNDKVSEYIILKSEHNFPKGFPRGKFLSEETKGTLRRFDPLDILRFIREQGE